MVCDSCSSHLRGEVAEAAQHGCGEIPTKYRKKQSPRSLPGSAYDVNLPCKVFDLWGYGSIGGATPSSPTVPFHHALARRFAGKGYALPAGVRATAEGFQGCQNAKVLRPASSGQRRCNRSLSHRIMEIFCLSSVSKMNPKLTFPDIYTELKAGGANSVPKILRCYAEVWQQQTWKSSVASSHHDHGANHLNHT